MKQTFFQRLSNAVGGMAVGMVFWIVLNIIELVWCLVFGVVAYGFTLAAVQVALYITAFSLVASLPGFLAMMWSPIEPYLGTGGFGGAGLTFVGSFVYFCLRVFFRLELPDPWSTALLVGGITVGLAVILFGFGLIDFMANYSRRRPAG